MSRLKRKERMRKLADEGMLMFVLKEGIINVGLKLGGLFLLVSFLITFRADLDAFLHPDELSQTLIFFGVIVAVGLYWGFIWYFVISTEKKREAELNSRKNKK